MPFEVKRGGFALRCSECNKIIKGEPIFLKTCCVNKPRAFCSKTCLDKWQRKWLMRQEQITKRSML